MKNQDNRSKNAADLRQKAEALARERTAGMPEDIDSLSPEQIRETLHELRVHQIELEMQNEELRAAQVEIEAGKARYFDLYDLAPVGYCTLSEKGLILEANLTAATLLGKARATLLKQPISRFILNEDEDIYYLHRKHLLQTGEPQECEVRLVKPDGAHFWAHLTATAAQAKDGAPVFRLVLSDITERKQAEGELKRIEWMLSKKPVSKTEAKTAPHDQGYGDLTELNRDGLILKSIGRERLKSFADDYLELMGTSSAIYEVDGDYAFGIFSSGWCRMMDCASRGLCETPDNAEALDSGRWLCHESCWTDCSKRAIAENAPVDIACNGGIRMYAVPILAHEKVVGAMNFGYGDPPTDSEQLRKIAETYHLDYEDLVREAHAYDSRPSFIIEKAKHRLHATARLIGSMIETKQAEEAVRQERDLSQNVIEHGPVGITIVNRDGVVESANRLAQEILRLRESAVQGRTYNDPDWKITAVDGTEFPEDQLPVPRVLDTGEAVHNVQHAIEWPNGQRRIVSINAAPLKNPEGLTERVVCSIADITENKQAEEALCESESRVRAKLDALLDPEADLETLNLADVLDCDQIQSLMNDFHVLTDIGVGIIDLEGNVLVRTGWQDVCTKFHRVHPETAKNCIESDTILASGVEPGTFKVYKCKNNMWDMVTPIMIGERHLGNLFLGQFFFEDEEANIDVFREQAQRYGFDEEAYLESYRAIPRWSRQTVDVVMAFYCNLIGVISRLSYAQIKLARASEALRHNEQRFRSFVENANDMVYALSPEGVFTYMSPNWLESMGEPAEEAIGKSFEPYVHPEDVHLCRAFLEKTLTTGKKQSRVEYRVRHRDGSWRWHVSNGSPVRDESGNVTGYVGIARDVTEANQVEEELRQRENLLQKIFETLPVGLWLADKDGVLLRGNPAGVRIWGAEPHVPPPEYSLFKAWRLPSGEPIRAEDWALAKTIREGITIVDELLEIEDFNGHRKTILNYTAPVLDEKGEVSGAIVVNLDVSDRMALEDKLSQAQKMESVGRLAGGVAHDFNNMLNVILGHSELALEDLAEDSPLRTDLDEIRKAAERSANLTSQLLAFARKQTVAPKDLDLNETIASMLTMLERLIGEDINLLWKPGKRLAQVRIDPGQVDQVLANLAVNARDAIGHANGKITIETSNVSFDEDYCANHAGFTPGDYVMLAVSDDGCGMDEETRLQIFEPFFTTKGVGEGTGLGLATIYGIVKQNDGFVNVYSEPGSGTTFRIYLPALKVESRQQGDARKSAAAPMGGHETILIVEDEPAILNMTRAMLQRLGYTVLTASSPSEGLRIAREQPGTINLLITDVVMPEMNGRDMARSLQECSPHIRSLFMSGYTANVIAHQGVLDEGVNFIQKPFSREQLAAKVREALDSSSND